MIVDFNLNPKYPNIYHFIHFHRSLKMTQELIYDDTSSSSGDVEADLGPIITPSKTKSRKAEKSTRPLKESAKFIKEVISIFNDYQEDSQSTTKFVKGLRKVLKGQADIQSLPNLESISPDVEVFDLELIDDLVFYCRGSFATYGSPGIRTHLAFNQQGFPSVNAGPKRIAHRAAKAFQRTVSSSSKKEELEARERELFAEAVGVPPEQVLIFCTENKFYLLPHMLWIDHKRKEVIFSIRGTASVEDVITDMHGIPETIDGTPEPIDGGQFVHQGMLRTARTIRARLEPELSAALVEHRGYRPVMIGHSLGGGVACILAHMLRPTMPEIRAYGFGCPACCSPVLCDEMEAYCTQVVFQTDIIPRLSIRSWMVLRKRVNAANAREGQGPTRPTDIDFDAPLPSLDLFPPGLLLQLSFRFPTITSWRKLKQATKRVARGQPEVLTRYDLLHPMRLYRIGRLDLQELLVDLSVFMNHVTYMPALMMMQRNARGEDADIFGKLGSSFDL
eukprot:gnl/Dysnectes_brevis/878_a973_1912.p1 GENE.gnl/Dysnectes_brevis/878_a973_1912~~gnl/Dysnectes_brevis/878_a973_1912.p1  ORF type:complete len:505 (-),score=175.86 gnl/Dysnectes_brevis/878_a973_1912:27-1541(-)